MQVVSEGFVLKYEILMIGTIKPGASGEYNGKPYKASVKFRSTVMYTNENEKVGIQEVENTIEFKIPCDSEDEAVQLAEYLRNARSHNDPVYINGSLPTRQQGADISNVTSFENAAAFLAHSVKKTDKKPQA